MERFDLAVIGAGPAGMAAAREAADLGLAVALLDEQARPGGQIYRDVERAGPLRGSILGEDYTEGARLTQAVRHDRIRHIAGAVLWAIEDGFCLSYTQDGRAARVSADRVLIATGALERPMPLPGWSSDALHKHRGPRQRFDRW